MLPRWTSQPWKMESLLPSLLSNCSFRPQVAHVQEVASVSCWELHTGSFPFFVHLQPCMLALSIPTFLKEAREYYGFMWCRFILMPRHSEPDPSNSSLPSVTQNAQQRALSSWHQPSDRCLPDCSPSSSSSSTCL